MKLITVSQDQEHKVKTRFTDRESERTGEDGTTQLVDQWDDGVKMPGMQGPVVIITLTADLYAEN